MPDRGRPFVFGGALIFARVTFADGFDSDDENSRRCQRVERNNETDRRGGTL